MESKQVIDFDSILIELTKRLNNSNPRGSYDRVLDDFVEALIKYISEDNTCSEKLTEIVVENVFCGDNAETLVENVLSNIEEDVHSIDRIKKIVEKDTSGYTRVIGKIMK